jgi:hypothetical protein
MAIIAKASSDGQTVQPAPEGTHQAVCVDVVDKGLLETTWQGVKKQQHKIDVAWQIGENRDDGKPFLVFKRYTLSLGEKANLRKDLESWRGKKFTREEEAGFDVEKLVGANCLLNILHNVSGDRTYANVQAVAPLIKGMAKIAAREYVRVQDRPADSNGHGKANGHSDEPPPYTDEDLSGGGPVDDIPFAPRGWC